MDQIIISDKLFIFDFQNLAFRTAMSIYGNIDSLGSDSPEGVNQLSQQVRPMVDEQ